MSESSTVGSRRVGRELIVLPTGDRWLEQNLLSLEHSDHPRCGADLRGAPRANAIGGPPPSSIPGHPQQHGVHRHQRPQPWFWHLDGWVNHSVATVRATVRTCARR